EASLGSLANGGVTLSKLPSLPIHDTPPKKCGCTNSSGTNGSGGKRQLQNSRFSPSILETSLPFASDTTRVTVGLSPNTYNTIQRFLAHRESQQSWSPRALHFSGFLWIMDPFSYGSSPNREKLFLCL